MRLYDFQCRACGKGFEELVREITDAKCPGCGSTHVEKVISAPSVGRSGKGAEPGDCNVMSCGRGACGSGGCGMN